MPESSNSSTAAGGSNASWKQELRSGFEILADRFASNGLSPAEARRAAHLEFEGLDQTKEKVRDALCGASLAGFLRDLGYASRSMCRRPSFALIAVLVSGAWLYLTGLLAGILWQREPRRCESEPHPRRAVRPPQAKE